MNAMYLRKHCNDDGTISIECVNPSPRIPITREFLDEADPEFVSRDGERFTLHCMNGTWIYQILEPTPWRPNLRTLTAVLIESEAA